MIQSAFGMLIFRHLLRHSDGCLIVTKVWSSEKKICDRVTDFGSISTVKTLGMDNTIQQEMYKIRGEPRMKPEKHHGLRNLQKTYQRRLKK